VRVVSSQNKEAALGWYLRKSVKVGPFRVNFSKSGIGYSFGVKGARIGAGPHGPYIAGGRGGIYYRQSLKTNPLTSRPPSTSPPILATSPHMYCTHCGAAILPGNDFCIQCGTRVMPGITVDGIPSGEEKHDHHLSWLVLGGALILLVLLRSLGSLDSTKPVPPPLSSSSPANAIERSSVPFRVEQKAQGKPIIVWLAPDVSVQQVSDVVRYFKSEIQSRRFGDLGITVPTFVRQAPEETNYSAGTVLFYRKTSIKQATSQKKGSKVAEYKWGIEGSFQKDSGLMWVDASHTTKLF
jgi:Protein of unknown function (DUF4236)/zinc-ribbon domain